MNMVDYQMAEYTAKQMLDCFKSHKQIPNDIFENLLTSSAYLVIQKAPIGPNVENLYRYLEAAYAYGDLNKLDGFDQSFIYGVTKFYDKFQEIKNN